MCSDTRLGVWLVQHAPIGSDSLTSDSHYGAVAVLEAAIRFIQGRCQHGVKECAAFSTSAHRSLNV